MALFLSAPLIAVTPRLATPAPCVLRAPPRCGTPRAAALDPGYMFVCRCEGAASALLSKYTPSPGMENYVTINVTANAFIGPPPASIFELAALQFGRNLRAIFGSYDEIAGPLSPSVKANRAKLAQLKLSTDKILQREEARGGIPPDTPDVIRVPYVKLCQFIDVVFEER